MHVVINTNQFFFLYDTLNPIENSNGKWSTTDVHLFYYYIILHGGIFVKTVLLPKHKKNTWNRIFTSHYNMFTCTITGACYGQERLCFFETIKKVMASDSCSGEYNRYNMWMARPFWTMAFLNIIVLLVIIKYYICVIICPSPL